MPSLETESAESICKQLRTLTGVRSAHEKQLAAINDKLAPINRALKENEEQRQRLKAKLKTAMESACEKSVAFPGISAVIMVGRAVEIIDQDAAVAAITELGRLDEITKVTFNQTAIKLISDGQTEPLPGVEIVETRTLRVTER